jgi:hypothetical protein
MTRITHHASRFISIQIIVVLFIVLASLYSLTTPLFETPDEPSHFAYIKALVDGRGFPVPPIAIADDQAAQESSQPPLFYVTASFAIKLFAPNTSDFSGYLTRNPSFPYLANESTNDNKNVFVHAAPEDFPYTGTVLAVHIARLVAMLFGAITVLATYGLAREIFPDRKPIALIAASIVAFTPQFIFISGAASNDTSAAAMCAVTLWLTARVLQRGFTLRRSIILSIVLSLALLSKASAIALVPLIAGVIIFWNPIERRLIFAARLKWTVFIAGLALALTAPWYLRTWSLFGDLFGITPHLGTPWARPAAISIGAAFTQLPGAITSYWLAFGWGNIIMPDWIYLLLNVLAVGGLIGVAIWLRREANLLPKWIAVILIIWAAIIFAALIRWVQLLNAPLGRLIFPAISALSILIAVGWGELSRRVRSNALAAVMPVGLFILSVTALPGLLQPAYARPQILSTSQIDQQPGRSIDVRYGAVARLIKIDVPQSNWPQPGDEPSLRVCWAALSADSRPLLILLQLVGPDNRVVATRRTLPGLGSFPTAIWRAGDRFCDVMHISIGTDAPAPAIYKVEVGIIDPQTRDRLPAYAPDGSQLGTNFVDAIKIAPKTYATPQIDRPVKYRLGDQIELIGYSIDPASIERSGIVHLRLYWRALKHPAAAYTVFVHIRDDQGHLLTQADSQPQNDLYPTSFWDANEIVIDDRSIQIPADAASGVYTIAVGLYNPLDNSRLPVNGVANGEIDLPLQVQVR